MSTDLATRVEELEHAVRELRERYRFLGGLDAAIQPLVDPGEIMQTAARTLAEYLVVDRCAYANVEDERTFVITGDWTRGVPSIVGRWEVAAFGPACVAHMVDNTPYVVEDAEADDRIVGAMRDAYRATDIRAVICVPLHKRGVLTAAMAVHQKVPRRWTAADVEVTTAVVARSWEALERASAVRVQLASERALREHRARLDYAVQLSGVGFWYCDLPFDELLWDERVKAHFWLPTDARVTIDLFYERIHPDDREPTRAAIDLAITNRTTYDVLYRTVDPASGQVKHIRALGGAAYAADDTPLRFDGVTLDVTALRLQDRRKDEFIATLAHELRNPLAPIRTGLSLLGRTSDPALTRRAITMMDRQLVHLVRLVDDLLDVSRITQGKVALVIARCDLREVIDAAIETVHAQIESAGHELVVELPPGPLPIDVDATRIAQVFANLLSNAAKYTPRRGHLRVVGTPEPDGGWRVDVRDDGIGIDAAELPRLFEMFTQLGQSIDRANGGLGIGLTLARRLVELHHGTLVAASPGPGAGSTFTVRLPGGATGTTVVRAPAPVERAPAPRTVLVVDDNQDAADMLSLLLERDGYQTLVAHSGPEALELATRARPAVVLLDLGLPGLDGYEVARRLRADPSLAELLLVAVTGWGADEDRRRSKDAGFDHHLIKPIDHARLTELLATPARRSAS